MNMFKPSALTLLILSTLLTACSTMSDKKTAACRRNLKTSAGGKATGCGCSDT